MIEVIYEDEGLVALSKPSGLQVHPVKAMRLAREDRAPTLTDWLLERYPEVRQVGDDPEERPGIVHRLDKDTSGIIVVARDQDTFNYLKETFQSRSIKKTYLALLRGHVAADKGVVDLPIGIKSGSVKRSIHSAKMAKTALTEYAVLERLSSADVPSFVSTLASVSPKTGRTHQIRVHMAALGHAVLGDPLYGPRKAPAWVTRLMLHARSIEFERSPGVKLNLEAPLDLEFERVLSDAGLSDPGRVSSL